jgi:hypothetical protein
MPECRAPVPVVGPPVVARPFYDPSRPSSSEPVYVEEIKSPSTALALSLGTTVVGYGLAYFGNGTNSPAVSTTGSVLAFIGPTTGHIYAGQTWNPGLKYRLIGLGVTAVGFVVLIGACPPFGGQCNEGLAMVGVAGAVGGAVTYAGATIYEIATAPSAATDYNRKRAGAITLAPMIGRQQGGLAVMGRF